MQFEELQTIQWPKDTKKVIRSCKSKNYRQYNGQKKQDKMTSNDLQNTTQKTKNLATRTQLKNRGKLRCIQFYCSALNIFNKNRQVQLQQNYRLYINLEPSATKEKYFFIWSFIFLHFSYQKNDHQIFKLINKIIVHLYVCFSTYLCAGTAILYDRYDAGGNERDNRYRARMRLHQRAY